ncbi:MAG TPA: response regulator [Thermoanaerobaculia bacterium]|nr:response regulator [Thermoanaerobaculia bacterium]
MAKKILLADDSITIQKVVELTFSDGDYEVTAVNNGAKAIQKLSEMRPDIILSDIIMPEKNGYEVCEFVKSHPEYRTIPVVLLTGTFEPFDPDRADKAGCDAVVTKPFESQSLIHKVEELIDQAKSTAPTAPSPAIPATPPPPPAPSFTPPPPPPPAALFTPPPPPPAAPPAAPESDVFGASPPAEAFSGETRAIPKINFDELPKETSTQQIQAPPQPPAAPSPWGEPAAPPAGETRAFPRMNFEEMHPPQAATPPEPESEPESPFGAPPAAESFSGETRAFPKMSFGDLNAAATTTPPPAPAPPPHDTAPSPWDEQPAYSGETRSFPKMSFDEIEGRPSEIVPPASPAAPWDDTPSAPSTPAWSMPEPAAPPEPEPAAEEEPSMPTPEEQPAWAATPEPPIAMPAPPSASSEPSAAGNGVDLSEEQIDRIARRVVQLMSDQVVRSIAWEVIPDLAEMVVKERIRQLEGE